MMRAYYGRGGSSSPAATDRSPGPAAQSIRHRTEAPMIRKLTVTILAALALTLSAGCVYVAPISQGNVLDQEDVDQVETGMTRGQIRFLLGTPMIDDPFHEGRWDYVYFLRVGREKARFKRWVSVFFEDEIVSEVIKDQELRPDL